MNNFDNVEPPSNKASSEIKDLKMQIAFHTYMGINNHGH
jgi:hypothetical protein